MASNDGHDAVQPTSHYNPSISAFSLEKAFTAQRTERATNGTPNTRRVQDTGLGPSVQDPSDQDYSDPTRQASPFVEIGSSGLAQYGGFVRDEFLPQLQGDAGLRVFREMFDNDPIVGALVFAIQMLMRKVEWRVEPPESPTVEGIVAARQKERMQMVAQRAQSIAAQAAQGAGGQGSGASSMAAGGHPVPGAGQPTPAFAAPSDQAATPFHAPLPELAGHSAPPAAPHSAVPIGTSSQVPNQPSGTPDNKPGANAPNTITSPSSNFPARPNSPASNPGGGPNQHGAIGGKDGLPGGRALNAPAPNGDPGSDLDADGMPVPKTRVVKSAEEAHFDEWYETLEKGGGGASSGGGQIGGIEALDVGNNPTDPETGEPMEFPIGTSPIDPPSPEEQKALELAVLVETCLHDMTDSWSDLISQIITMIVYGFSFHELVYKKRNGPNPLDPTQGSRYADGKIGWSKIAGRAQETRHRWEFDEFGNILGMWQLAPPKFQLKYLPMSKCLLFRTTGYKQNPEGRALALNTPIPTPDGWRTMADLQVGDPIFDEAGRTRYVTATADWDDRSTYRVTFSDGSHIDADENHLWLTQTATERYGNKSGATRTTLEILETLTRGAGTSNHSISWSAPVRYPQQLLPLDPYVLGLWLGDGVSIAGQIATHADDAEEEAALIEQAGFSTKVFDNGPEGCLGRLIGVYGLSTPLRAIGVFGDKHVPKAYLRGSVEQRLALLSGLMDSDGTVDADGRCEFTNTNMNLVDAVAELVRSLGCSAHVSLRKRANGTSHKQDSWCVKFTPEFVPFHLSRKLARIKPVRARKQHYIVSIEQIANQTTKCIEVDSPSHLFLAGNYIPTHNSILRSAYRPWYFKRRIEEYEAIGVERNLAGMPIAYVPYQWMSAYATPEESGALDEVKRIVRNVRNDEQAGLVFPTIIDPETKQPLFKFELVSTGTGSSSKVQDTDKIIGRYDQRIAMVALVDFILLGHESVGSKSLADTKADLFTTALEAWLDVIADIFNTYAIPRLIQMNGEDPAMSPRLAFGKLARVSLMEISQLLTAMAGAGADLFPDAILEDFVREAAGMPPKSATDDL